ncbi:MAG: sulfotransferase domain-containing protein [Acidimicrobiia bacterium]|nr:sulfotransferase domain-containing protein [Acidimicrobiia bacterium]
MIPNLYILGAPKCGTTTLTAWLRQHPDVVATRVKEPHYYYSPYGEPRSRDEYEALYATGRPGSTYVDSSVWYLFGRAAAPKIVAETPTARFVVCVRNPVDMVPSLHAQKLLTGHEKLTDLQEAWDVADARASGSNVGIYGIPDGDPAHMSYKAACLLGAQVRDLLQAVDRSQVLIVLLEDIATEPDRIWRLVCSHAGLDPVAVDLASLNIAAVHRRSQLGHRLLSGVGAAKKALGLSGRSGLLAPLHRLNLRSGRYTAPPQSLRQEMSRYFRDDIELLASLIDRDLGHWLTAAEQHTGWSE